MAKEEKKTNAQGAEGAGAETEMSDEDLERYLDGEGDDEGDGGEQIERSLASQMPAPPKTVSDAAYEAAPEAYEALPVLQAIAKSIDANLAYLAQAFTLNAEATEAGFNNLSKGLTEAIDDQNELVKSLQEDLDGLGRRSTRPSDAAGGEGGLLQKGGLLGEDGAPMSRREVQARLEKAVMAGQISPDHLTTIELRGFMLTEPEANLVKSIQLDGPVGLGE